ncbi:hypothetical protein K440DRAFT_658996 [Wilcoxina mikolae CBS 423.85]|nr:hypothetical protein K440DRAFT_658996 [Wilcoxina mikolae CBS 423.85]
MSDAADEASKAEKLAAAKKRVCVIPRSRGVQGWSGAGDGGKKGGKAAAAVASSASAEKPAEEKTEEPENTSEAPPLVSTEEPEESASSPAPEVESPKSATPPPPTGSPSPIHARTASIQARRTSASHYRRPSVNASDLLRSANKSPLSPTDVPDIYYRQAETISTLTTDNEKLSEEVEKLRTKEKRLSEIEAEKDKLQEQLAEVREELRGVKGRIDGAEQGKKTSEEEMEKMKSELATLHRQTSHLSSQVSAKDKTIAELRLTSSGSSNSQDRESLTAKEDQIENMEIDLNKLRNELERTQKSLASAESSLNAKETAFDALKEELSKAQRDLESANSKISEEVARYSTLDSQLRAAQKDLEIAKADIKKKNASIASLDKDYYTLKTMYRDAESKSQESSRLAISKSREVQDLEDSLAEEKRKAGQLEAEREDFRIKLERVLRENRRLTGAFAADDETVDELEDLERNRLRERIRILEEELDAAKKHHNIQHPQTRQTRAMSMLSEGSLLSDDVDFGEMMKNEMLAARQKEEAAAEERKRAEMERLERIRGVKRGLEKWKGWRVDLTLIQVHLEVKAPKKRRIVRYVLVEGISPPGVYLRQECFPAVEDDNIAAQVHYGLSPEEKEDVVNNTASTPREPAAQSLRHECRSPRRGHTASLVDGAGILCNVSCGPRDYYINTLLQLGEEASIDQLPPLQKAILDARSNRNS